MIEVEGLIVDLSIIRNGKGCGKEGVASEDPNLHGVLGIDELEKHVQELAFIS